MTFAEAVRTCFRNYVTFSGRARRPEYWWFVLFIVLGSIVAGILDGVLFGAAETELRTGPEGVGMSASASGPITTLFSLGTFLPALAAGWRRMHDTGRSGLYLLYPLIVIAGIGGFLGVFGGFVQTGAGGMPQFTGLFGVVLGLAVIVLIVSPFLVIWWLTRPTQPGPNEYGPEPKSA